MPTPLESKIRSLHDLRFKEFEAEIVREKSLAERAAKFEATRAKRRNEFLKAGGANLEALERELEKDRRLQEAELQAFLTKFRPPAVKRKSQQAADAKFAESRRKVLKEAKHEVLAPVSTVLYAVDRNDLKGVSGESGVGAIQSGWVFPDPPGRIRLKDTAKLDIVCFQAGGGGAAPEFAVHFSFVPATTARYEMTAVLAFHGFYVLRSDDSWYNCREAKVKLTARMNVHQFVDHPWKRFPAMINHRESNTDQVTHYDRANFFDYTAVLKGGEPVVVTVKGIVDAQARGGGAYAELNFEAGESNYIEPLLLSVAKA